MYNPENHGLGAFPELPYPLDALEPVIDKETMALHYGKHMRAYYDNAIAASKKVHEAQSAGKVQECEETMKVLYNNLGGFYNHTLFFTQMAPSGKAISAETPLYKAITKFFGSFEEFKTSFEASGLACFGSGWVWLLVHAKTKALSIEVTANQDPPKPSFAPILGIDLWEHSYYLKYNNRRGDYLKAIWNVIDWEVVNNRFIVIQ